MKEKIIIALGVLVLILGDLYFSKTNKTNLNASVPEKAISVDKNSSMMGNVSDKKYNHIVKDILTIPKTPEEFMKDETSVNNEKVKINQDSVLKDFILNYKRPKWQTRNYFKSIKKYSKEYNIDPMVLASLIAVECSFNPFAKHHVVTVKTHKGKVTTRAIGAGVIFEVWEKELKRIGVRNKRELINIDNNVKSAAYILFILKKRKQIRGTSSLEESALLRYYGVIRRNGVVVKTYAEKVYGKIKKSEG